tara:strand:- start:1064 stop:1477 length:414 start_codon:yes stop_codon:yes gene_type:complete
MSDSTQMTPQSSIKDAIFCSSCGNSIASDAAFCPKCGSPNKANPQAQAVNQQVAQPQMTHSDGRVDGKVIKSRAAAGILGIFLGAFGIHKFYCGSIGLGIVYLLFFWTFIPGIVGFIEGIIYLTQPDDETFTRRYCI